MDEVEQARISDWVHDHASTFILTTKPDDIRDVPTSSCIRLRWYTVTIQPVKYLVGLNVHYGGTWGAMWVKNLETKETLELHPKAEPRHNLPQSTLSKVISWLPKFAKKTAEKTASSTQE